MPYESSVISLYKKLKFVMVKLSFDAYNGQNHPIMHYITRPHSYAHI